MRQLRLTLVIIAVTVLATALLARQTLGPAVKATGALAGLELYANDPALKVSQQLAKDGLSRDERAAVADIAREPQALWLAGGDSRRADVAALTERAARAG